MTLTLPCGTAAVGTFGASEEVSAFSERGSDELVLEAFAHSLSCSSSYLNGPLWFGHVCADGLWRRPEPGQMEQGRWGARTWPLAHGSQEVLMQVASCWTRRVTRKEMAMWEQRSPHWRGSLCPHGPRGRAWKANYKAGQCLGSVLSSRLEDSGASLQGTLMTAGLPVYHLLHVLSLDS